MLDESIALDGHVVRLSFRGDTPVAAAEVRRATGEIEKVAPVLRFGTQYSCEFDLSQFSADGAFSIHLRTRHGPPFGRTIAAKQRDIAWAKAGQVERPRAAKIAGSRFERAAATTHAAIYVDLVELALRLRLSSRDDIEPFLASLGPGRTAAAVERPAVETSTVVSGRAKWLDARLWGGLSVPALQELATLHGQQGAPRGERVGAAWAMARWCAVRGEHDRALELIESMHALAGARIVSPTVLVLESECLLRLGRTDQARAVLQQGMAAQNEFNADLCLAYANCFAGDPADDGTRLQWVNRVYQNGGFASIAKADENRPLAPDNLAAPAAERAKIDDGPAVSVIVPVYNAAETIGLALESVVRQTWPNIEIIVVDDCSTDGTWDVVRALAREHDAIAAVRQQRNQGAYVARNRGLELATGDLITIHDADDWSHPQQIETQVRGLMARPDIRGSRTHWTRVTANLHFRSIWRAGDTKITVNYSSLMFGRKVIEWLGAWDSVRANADSEFVERAERVFGAAALAEDHPQVPLALALILDASLTSSGETHLSTASYGVRRDYLDAAKWWHQRDPDVGRLKLDPKGNHRPFPVPPSFLPDRQPRPPYDLLVVADSNARDDGFTGVMAYVRYRLSQGSRVAFFHWPDFESFEPLHPAIWSLAAEGKLDVISAGEELVARTVLIGDPGILRYAADRPPDVDLEELIVNGARSAGGSSLGDPTDRTLLELFGTIGEWRAVAELMPAGYRNMVGDERGGPDPGPVQKPLSRDALIVFDRGQLEAQKTLWKNGDEVTAGLAARLKQEADAALTRGRLSVVDKTALPPSGDPHDYLTASPYYWPDPDKPDGLPYQFRDGVRVPAMQLYHPESGKYDRTRAQRLFDDVTTLALAWHFTGDRRYADHASQVLHTWFVDPSTRMNPHLRYAQVQFGHRNDEGTHFGLLEFKDLYYMLDAVKLLSGSGAMDAAVEDGLRAWLHGYLAWVTGSPAGRAAADEPNNLGPLYDLQVMAIAHYLGAWDEVDKAVQRARRRIAGHFDPDGRQPHEIDRTLSQHYCAFNLQGWTNLATAAESVGVDLWHEQSPHGAGLEQGLRWLFSFFGRDWPYRQIEPFDDAKVVPLGLAYKRAYPAADARHADCVLAEVAAPILFHPSAGVRPFWQLGAPGPRSRAAEPRASVHAPAIRPRADFVTSEKLRQNESFIQFLAFGFTFTAEPAVGVVQRLAGYREAHGRLGSEWQSLSEDRQNAFIEDLLVTIVRDAVAPVVGKRTLTIGLSGGYDARPILYALRKLGHEVRPFCFGQIGQLDYDFVQDLAARMGFDVELFDTSEIDWSLDAFDQWAAETLDLPISPRVMARVAMNRRFPNRIELHGYVNGFLTGANFADHPDDSWADALETFRAKNDFFGWQHLIDGFDPAALLPREPLVDREVIPYAQQLGFAYREWQRIRPLPEPRSAEFCFVYEDPRWLGFWLGRGLSELSGQRRYLQFLRSLGSEVFWDLAAIQTPTRADLQHQRKALFYGSDGVPGRIDLGAAGKATPRPSPSQSHFCFFATYRNNPSFRDMVNRSLQRLRKRGVFAPSFIDDVMRRFEDGTANADGFLNGLVTTDVALEAGRFAD